MTGFMVANRWRDVTVPLMHRLIIMVVLGITLGFHPGLTDIAAGKPVPTRVRDIEGKWHDPLQPGDRTGTVLVFVQPDCPISNQFAPLLERLHQEFGKKGVTVYLVYPDAELGVKRVAQHVKEFRFTATALLDPKHTIVKKLDVTVTPEAFVLNPKGEVVYQGRVNNRYVSFGKKRPRATRQDLRLAIEALVAGHEVELPKTRAIGCYIDRD